MFFNKKFAIILLFSTFWGAVPWKHACGWLVDPPQGWAVRGERASEIVEVSDSGGREKFRIFTFPAGRFANRKALEAYGRASLWFEGELLPVDWSDWYSSLGHGRNPGKGAADVSMAGVFHHPTYGCRLVLGEVSQAEAASFEKPMLSFLDSFAPHPERVYEPGLIGRGKGGFSGARPALTLAFGGGAAAR